MLNDTKIHGAKPRDRAFKLYDERGLFLLVTPTGGRLWRLKYQLPGHEKLISLGAYPDVTLKRARDRREAARKLIADEIDPSAQRRTGVAIAKRVWPEESPEWKAAAEARRVYEYRSKSWKELDERDPSHADAYLTLCAQNRREQEVFLAQLIAAGKNPNPPAE